MHPSLAPVKSVNWSTANVHNKCCLVYTQDKKYLEDKALQLDGFALGDAATPSLEHGAASMHDALCDAGQSMLAFLDCD
jgi:hypothetical protein